MLDAVVDYLPAPARPPRHAGHRVEGRREKMTPQALDDEPFSALAFKIMADPFVGSAHLLRVYSGKIERDVRVQLGQGQEGAHRPPAQMHANSREDVDDAVTGDIVAIAGLKDTTTGDTLCAQDNQIILERMEFPDPVIKVAVEPKTKADHEKMSQGLVKLAAEDPSFHFTRDEETNQTVIEGMGELHLEIIVDRLKREFKVEADIGAPQVNYRESISKPPRPRYTPQEAVRRFRPVRRGVHLIRAPRARHRLSV